MNELLTRPIEEIESKRRRSADPKITLAIKIGGALALLQTVQSSDQVLRAIDLLTQAEHLLHKKGN